MNLVSQFENFVSSFFKKTSTTEGEEKVVAAFQLTLPIIEGLAAGIETEAGLSSSAKVAITHVLSVAQAVLGALASSPSVTNIESAYAALTAVGNVIAPDATAEGNTVIAMAQAAYAEFKAGITVTPSAAASALASS